MDNAYWMTAKDVVRVNAFKWPNKIGAKDLYKAYTFKRMERALLPARQCPCRTWA